MVAEFLPPENVGQMNFDDRQTARQQSIQNRDGRMRISRGIDDNRGVGLTGFLNPRNQIAFVIALTEIDGEAQRFTFGDTSGLDVLQRFASVYFRLSGSQHIQVGTVYNQDFPVHIFLKIRNNHFDLYH